MKSIFVKIILLFSILSIAHTETTWTTGHYSNNAYIQHKLSIENALTVTIKGETEKGHDFIRIYDCHSKEVGRFSGTINETFTVSGSFIRAILTSNNSVTKNGVTISISSGEKTKTWTTGHYGNHKYLQHKLSIEKTSTVTVKGETEENKDFIIIYDSHHKEVGRFSGIINKTFTINDSSIKAILKSNGSITKSGVTVSISSATNHPPTASGISYYINAISGNDSNNGTSPSSAWKTLAKVEASSKNFNAGDIIHFKGGESFVGTLNLQNIDGNTSNPITFTSYGTGQANITNAIKIDNWKNEGSNIWSKSIEDNVYQVFKGNVSLKNARSEFMKLNQGGTTNLSSDDLINKTGILNAYVYVYPRAWISFSRKIIDYTPSTGKITLDRALNYGASNDNRLYILNSLGYMTHQDDWVYDENKHKLYIYSNNEPTNINVAINKTNGLNIKNSHYLKLENLKFSKVNNDCIHIDSSSNINMGSMGFDNPVWNNSGNLILYRSKRLGKFDVIFSRNMLIYFDDESRKQVAMTFYEMLKEKSFIFLGHAESMSRIVSVFKTLKVADSILYQKA